MARSVLAQQLVNLEGVIKTLVKDEEEAWSETIGEALAEVSAEKTGGGVKRFHQRYFSF